MTKIRKSFIFYNSCSIKQMVCEHESSNIIWHQHLLSYIFYNLSFIKKLKREKYFLCGFPGFTSGQGIDPYIPVSHGIWLYIHVSRENPGFPSGQGIRLKFTSAMGIQSIPFTGGHLMSIHGSDVNQCPIHIGHGNQTSNDIGQGISTLGQFGFSLRLTFYEQCALTLVMMVKIMKNHRFP